MSAAGAGADAIRLMADPGDVPWEKALQLFPTNPKVTAGARAKDLPVSFAATGVAQTTE